MFVELLKWLSAESAIKRYLKKTCITDEEVQQAYEAFQRDYWGGL